MQYLQNRCKAYPVFQLMTRFLKVIHPLKLCIRKCSGTRAKSNLIEIIQVDGEEDANVKSLICTDGQTTDNRQSEKPTSCWLIRPKGLTYWNLKKKPNKLRLPETTFIAGTLTKSTMNTFLPPPLSLSLTLTDTHILTMTWHKPLTFVLLWVTVLSSKCFLQCFVFFHEPFSQSKFFCKGTQ